MSWGIDFIKQVVAVRPPEVFITPYTVITSLTANALDAGDAIGDKFVIKVPVSGIIQSASLLDRDDEGTQIDVALLSGEFTAAAGDAAFSLSDIDAELEIIELQFTSFSDNVNNQTSFLENIGKAYRVPPIMKNAKFGFIHAQGITRATPTIAVSKEPMIRLEILPDRPV